MCRGCGHRARAQARPRRFLPHRLLRGKGSLLRLSYWPAVWKKAISKWRLSGTISNPSMAALGVESWISSARASLASQSLALGSDEPKKTSDGFGLTSLASFARYDRESSYWRTYQGSLFADSETFSESWPPSGSMRSGCVFEHRSLEHRTSGVGFSFWPGVSATRYGSSQNEGEEPRQRIQARCWPTPRAEDAESCGNHPGRQDSLNATVRTERWALDENGRYRKKRCNGKRETSGRARERREALADTAGIRERKLSARFERQHQTNTDGRCEDFRTWPPPPTYRGDEWPTGFEPAVRRVADGLSFSAGQTCGPWK